MSLKDPLDAWDARNTVYHCNKKSPVPLIEEETTSERYICHVVRTLQPVIPVAYYSWSSATDFAKLQMRSEPRSEGDCWY